MMSKGNIPSAQLDQLLESIGRCKVAQRALDTIPVSQSPLAKKQLGRALTRIQVAIYNPKIKPMTFADMVRRGRSFIEADATKHLLGELLMDAVLALRNEYADELEQSAAMAAAR